MSSPCEGPAATAGDKSTHDGKILISMGVLCAKFGCLVSKE